MDSLKVFFVKETVMAKMGIEVRITLMYTIQYRGYSKQVNHTLPDKTKAPFSEAKLYKN